MPKKPLVLIALALAATLVGCEQRLETGYAPRPLNANEATRRAYYAPAYSPEAEGIKKDQGGALNLAP